MDRDYLELKAWLEETRDEPLEAMGAFFDSRISEYEDHMSPWHETGRLFQSRAGGLSARRRPHAHDPGGQIAAVQ